MLTASSSDGRVELRAELEPGAVAYFDVDWLPASPGSVVPALVVGADGAMRWNGERQAVPPDREADEVAGAVLSRIARDAAAAVERAPDGPVEVTGRGAIAAAVRSSLDLPESPTATDPPAAIVDTTGDPAMLIRATERLADRGVLVLAGETGGRPLPLNVYPDVHRRGLRLVGVAPPLSIDEEGANQSLRPCVGSPTKPPPNLVLEGPRGWYRVKSG